MSRRGVPGALAGLLAAGLLGAVPAPASAETARVVDERGTALQGPANQLLSGRLTYTRDRTVLVARVERLSRARTWVGGSLYYPDDSYVKVSVTHRSGELVVRGHYHQADEDPLELPVQAAWDQRRGRVRIVLDAADDPKPFNDRARLDVYTVTKGWMHGPHCPMTREGAVRPCNDDYVSARLSR